ncbi:MAG: PQQ-dependent sugar dehydrogenase [Acidobacteria bacterium]|nr:PQQ-dependent sugar dehydrogenase [Acidobacteriota bacterium]
MESGPKRGAKLRSGPSTGGSLILLLGRGPQPVLMLSHAVAVAPDIIAGFWNDLFLAGLEGAHLRRIRFDLSDPSRITDDERLLDGQFGRLRDVVAGPDGGLYVATSNRDGSGSRTTDDDRIIRLMPVR